MKDEMKQEAPVEKDLRINDMDRYMNSPCPELERIRQDVAALIRRLSS